MSLGIIVNVLIYQEINALQVEDHQLENEDLMILDK